MATAVETALAEVNAALVALAPPREGFKDFARLNLKPESVEPVNRVIIDLDQRWDLLQDVKRVIANLLNDGYPALPKIEFTAEVVDDLRQNTSTVDAAFAMSKAEGAATFSFTEGGVEPK